MTDSNAPPVALLFDLDGTLIDSLPQHHEAWAQWHARIIGARAAAFAEYPHLLCSAADFTALRLSDLTRAHPHA